MGCSGCRINKESSSLPSEETLENLTALFAELKDRGIALNEIEIGPSDVLSARNKEEIFNDPKVIEFVDLFSLMTINASFIYPDDEKYKWLAENVNNYKTAKKLGIVIPVELNQVFNEKYINRIKHNLKVFQQHHPHKLYSTTFNIIFDERFVQNPLNKFSYEDLFFRMNNFVNDTELHPERVRIDYVFHHGRDNLENPLVAQAFIESMNKLYDHYFIDHEKRYGKDNIAIPSFLNFDFENDEIVYHDDKLYIRPVINDRLSVFHPDLVYHGEWDADGMMSHLAERYNSNLNKAMDFKDCSTCSRVVDCSKRYTQDLMSILKTETCITMLKKYDTPQG